MEENRIYIHNGVEHEVTAEEEADWLLEHDGATLKDESNYNSNVQDVEIKTTEQNIDTEIVEEKEKNDEEDEEEEIVEEIDENIEDDTQEIIQSQENPTDIQEDLIQEEITDEEYTNLMRRAKTESYTGQSAYEVIGGDYNNYLSSTPDMVLHAGNGDDWFMYAIENGLPLDGKDGHGDEFILKSVYNMGWGYNPSKASEEGGARLTYPVDPDTGELMWSNKIPSNSKEITKKLIETHKKNKLENTDFQNSIKEQKEEKEWERIQKSSKDRLDWKDNYFEEKKQLENIYEPINIKSSIKGNLTNTEFRLIDEILTYDNAKQWFDNRSL
jgi:hypothetical protein